MDVYNTQNMDNSGEVMTRVMVAFLLGLAAVALHAGGVYKWTDENGQVHFGDAPPSSTTKREKLDAAVPKSATVETNDAIEQDTDYYSPQRQLERIKANNEEEHRKALERRKQSLIEMQQSQSSTHDQNVNVAKCNYYEARVKEKEHDLLGGYFSDSDRLKDETKLAQLKYLAASFCK